MGRAASSCLKIMACGGGRASAGGDDEEAEAPVLPPAEAKSPQDKAKWNFLRSSRNQVSSNNIVVSGPLASVPEKDEDSEASNKGCSPQQQPEQAASGKVRMMKFAEFVPKLSFHLTEPELLDSLSAEKDNATGSTDASHQESHPSEHLPLKDDANDSTDTLEESKASAPVPACDVAATETGHSAKESAGVENDATKHSNPSLHASEASTPARQSVDVDHALIRESAAIKIQTATRAHLAHLAQKKHNNATKLQAAVRGYLVRREAVGTLRCVQAILKMQALVRARRSIHHNAGKLDKKEPLEALVHEPEGLVYMGKESSASGNHALDLLNEKLLKTGFILQLLESTPRSKPIYISCQPSRSDSAWRWLERWMTVISSDSMLQPESNLGAVRHDPEEPVELNCSKEPSQTSAAEHLPEIPGPCLPVPNIAVKENVDGSDALECHAATSTQGLIDEATQGLIDEAEEYLVDRDASEEASEAGKSDADESDFCKIETQSCGIDVEPAKESNEVEDLNKADESVSSQQKEPKAIHCVFDFIEAHNNELAAEHVEVKSLNVEGSPSCLKKEPTDIPIPYSHSEAESLQEENAESHETSVSSSSSSSSGSLHSTESESEEVACEKGITDSEKHVLADLGEHGDENPANDNPSETLLNENVETVDENVRLFHSADGHAGSELSAQQTPPNELDVHENVGQSRSAAQCAKPELPTELPTTLGERVLNENGGNKRAYSSSPEQSPSHPMIKASSYETPPSQISVNTENVNAGDDHANQKQGSSEPRSKRALSASDSKPDQSVTDSKTTKKRHSIGSNNSLPSYMQATESAKAKVHASVSPKSSPDLKDSSRKKRLSLPAGTEKHNSSPRMQRSGSQVQQNPKANGVHAPLNFSERRWQR